jgi:hypothetical protein
MMGKANCPVETHRNGYVEHQIQKAPIQGMPLHVVKINIDAIIAQVSGWIIFLEETPSLGLTKNSTLQYMYHLIFIYLVEYRQKNLLSTLLQVSQRRNSMD